MKGRVAAIVATASAPEIPPKITTALLTFHLLAGASVPAGKTTHRDGGRSSHFRVILAACLENHAFEGHGMRRALFPIWTACVRRRAPSLSKRRLACVFTVFSETKRRSAISRLLRPEAIRSRISSSRGVMPSSPRRAGVRHEGLGRRQSDLPHVRQLPASQRAAEPDPDTRREGSDQAGIDLDRVRNDEEPVLRELENDDEQPDRGAVDEDVAHARPTRRSRAPERVGHGWRCYPHLSGASAIDGARRGSPRPPGQLVPGC